MVFLFSTASASISSKTSSFVVCRNIIRDVSRGMNCVSEQPVNLVYMPVQRLLIQSSMSADQLCEFLSFDVMIKDVSHSQSEQFQMIRTVMHKSYLPSCHIHNIMNPNFLFPSHSHHVEASFPFIQITHYLQLPLHSLVNLFRIASHEARTDYKYSLLDG